MPYNPNKPIKIISGGKASMQTPQVAPEQRSLGGFAQNVASSGGNMLGGLWNLVRHPIESTKTLGKVGIGAAQLAIPGEQGYEDVARGVGRFYKERYGGRENIKKTLYEDPVGAAADLATIFSLGGGALAKAGSLSKAAGLARTGAELAETAALATKIGRAVDPFITAGRTIRGTLNATTKPIMGAQKLLSGAISTVPGEAVGYLQRAGKEGGEAAQVIAKAMKDSDAIIPLVNRLGKVTSRFDDIVWKVAGAKASKIKERVSGANLAESVRAKLFSDGRMNIEPILNKKEELVGYRYAGGGPIGDLTVKKAILPALQRLHRLKDSALSVTQLWDESKAIGEMLDKVTDPRIKNAFLDTIHTAMPQNFWKTVQSQNEIRQLGQAISEALSQRNILGQSAVPGRAAQLAEGSLGRIWGKGKGVLRSQIVEWEKELGRTLDDLVQETGKSVDELVEAGTIDAEVASIMKNPQILNQATGILFSSVAPQALRAISAMGGGILGATTGLGAPVMIGSGLGFTLASPRVQGMLALTLPKGLGNLVGKFGPNQLGRAIPTAQKLRQLIEPSRQ